MRNYFVITYTSQINVTFGTSSVVTRWRYFKEPFDLIKKHATAESHTLILGHMDQWLPWKRWVSVRPYVSLGWWDRREKKRETWKPVAKTQVLSVTDCSSAIIIGKHFWILTCTCLVQTWSENEVKNFDGSSSTMKNEVKNFDGSSSTMTDPLYEISLPKCSKKLKIFWNWRYSNASLQYPIWILKNDGYLVVALECRIPRKLY